MKRRASVIWNGGTKGQGLISTESGALEGAPYTLGMRFDKDPGTNPEELIGAAHAACFSMALAVQLTNAGLTPKAINTTATVTVEKQDQGWNVTESHLDVEAEVPGASDAQFEKAANETKTSCPVSKLLKASITMNAKLV